MSAIVRKKHCSINEANCVGYACTPATFRQMADSQSSLNVRTVLICYSYKMLPQHMTASVQRLSY